MATMTSLHVPFEGWTVDDLPEDVDFSYELVDGALLVTPPADPRHDRVAMRLSRLLLPLGHQWDVLVDSGIFFDERNYREPDLIVCRRSAIDRGRVLASDVLLAVEVLGGGEGAGAADLPDDRPVDLRCRAVDDGAAPADAKTGRLARARSD